MNPPIVYEVTMPKSHNIKSTAAIVINIYVSFIDKTAEYEDGRLSNKLPRPLSQMRVVVPCDEIPFAP